MELQKTMTDSPPNVWPMYRAVVGLGILCSLAIVVVYEGTRPIIERKSLGALERAVIEVLPGATASRAYRLREDGSFVPAVNGEDLVYAGYDQTGDLVGLALVAKGIGYQDVIRILYGYSFEKQVILGFRVLESRETPGLGDRIETDPDFQNNFGSLDVSLATDGSGPAHPIEFVKPGEKNSAWQIDGISGATISSKAIAEMLRDSSTYWMPRVHPREEDFRIPISRNQRGEIFNQ
jgi:electron transport complex protein RnfG